MGWKHTAYHIINSDLGQTRSKQQLDKTLEITFASQSRKSDEKEKKKKQEVGDDWSVCVINILPKVSSLPSLLAINLMKMEI